MMFFRACSAGRTTRCVVGLLVGAVWAVACNGWAEGASPVASSAASSTSAAQPTRLPLPHTYTARVSRVFDGDTLWVKPLEGGRYRKLRLDGVDAPEICQSGGGAAREALAARVLNRVVTVRVHAFDTYGRALAQVSAGGEDVAGQLVRDGHAWSSRWKRSQGPYAAEEAQARDQRRGVFGVDRAETPRDFRRRNGPCPMP